MLLVSCHSSAASSRWRLIKETSKVMTTFKVAHIREQGQQMIIIPLSASFGHKTSREQSEAMDALRLAARSAGLVGTVATIWTNGNRVGFIAPKPWHPFFRSPGIYNLVMRNINRELTIVD